MTNPIDPVAKLGRWGLVGVMLALIISNIIAFYFIYQLASHHIAENSRIMSQVEIAITELSTIIKLPNKLSMK